MRILTLTCLFACLCLQVSSQNLFMVKFPDDKTFIGCNANVPVEMPVITQNGCSINVGVSRTDQVFTTNATGGCFKILRRWHLVHQCNKNHNVQPFSIDNPTNTTVGATAFGTVANNGNIQYTQIITVRDDVPPKFASCPTGTVVVCDYTNNNLNLYGNTCEGPVELTTEVSDVCSGTDINLTYRLYLDLDGNGSMETYINSTDPTAFPIEKTVVGTAVRGKILFPANYQLPYGIHKVEWVANDKCGNEALCKYNFEVRDCKNPTIVCKNGLSINLMQTGMVGLEGSNFIQYTQDNCTPSMNIKTAIRKQGQGTGFPTGSNSVAFDCNEQGVQYVEVWAQDASGNADFCLTYVVIQDNMGICAPTSNLSGTVMKAVGGTAAEGVKITALKPNQTVAATGQVQANGTFGPLPLYPGCYTVKAEHTDNSNTANGITTWDALLASLHNAGISPFDQPWLWAAADVDADGFVTEADALDIAKMAIGANTNWPAVGKWQIVAANTPLPEEQILFSTEICTEANLVALLDLLAFQTGNLDAGATNKGDGDAKRRTATFLADDKTFTAGDIVDFQLQAPHADGLAGFQAALGYDATLLEVVSVSAGTLENIQFKHQADQHAINLSWHNAAAFYQDGAALFKGQHAASIQFRALGNGKLSSALAFKPELLEVEVYTRDWKKHHAALQFQGGQGGRASASILRIAPVPSPDGWVTVEYTLPTDGAAQLMITDPYGRTVASQKVVGVAGINTVRMQVGSGAGAGFSLQLATATGVVAKRL